MKKTLISLCALALALSMLMSLASCGKKEEDDESLPNEDVITATEGTYINVYNWGQYISTGADDTLNVNAAFTEATGIKVNYTTFDSNESLLAKLETGGTSYDIIIPSDYMIERLIAKNMLEKIDFANIPNYANVDEEFKGQYYDPNNEYSVPYTFGTVGIIYNTKYVKKTVDSWNILWDSEYKDKILTFDNPRDLFSTAQFLLGQDINTTSDADFKAAYEKLKEQKPLVQAYVMDQIFDSMINEEAWIAPYYAGDFVTMHEDNPDLAFAFPKEGFNYFIDAICIPKGCQNKAGAEAYINFLCNPEISGQNMDSIGYATPISAAREYVSEDFVNSVAYPDSATLERGVMFKNPNDETNKLMNDYWSKLKVGGHNVWIYAGIAAVVVIAVGAVIIIKKKKKKIYDDPS